VTDPILITGAARSGTSMIAGCVFRCGAWGGKMSGPTRYNQRGMYENSEIRNQIVKPFLRKIGVDPLCQNPLPDIVKIEEMAYEVGEQWVGWVLRIIKRQGYKKGPWFYKGAKMCLLWPIWHEMFPFAKWVIVRRNAHDIASSCLKTGFMRGHKNRAGWLYWVAQHENRFREMYEAGLKIREVWPHKAIVYADFSELRGVIEWLGLEWNEKEVMEFISPALWSGKKHQANVA